MIPVREDKSWLTKYDSERIVQLKRLLKCRDFLRLLIENFNLTAVYKKKKKYRSSTTLNNGGERNVAV